MVYIDFARHLELPNCLPFVAIDGPWEGMVSHCGTTSCELRHAVGAVGRNGADNPMLNAFKKILDRRKSSLNS